MFISKFWFTVLSASSGPPKACAALMRFSPTPLGMGTYISRASEDSLISPVFRLTDAIIITSVRPVLAFTSRLSVPISSTLSQSSGRFWFRARSPFSTVTRSSAAISSSPRSSATISSSSASSSEALRVSLSSSALAVGNSQSSSERGGWVGRFSGSVSANATVASTGSKMPVI